jgi:hypothetical protein
VLQHDLGHVDRTRCGYFKWPFSTTYTTLPSPLTGFNSPAFSNPLELRTQPGRTYRIGATVEF